MTVLSDRVSDLLATDAVAEHRWLTERSWSRPTWTVAELEAAKRQLEDNGIRDAIAIKEAAR